MENSVYTNHDLMGVQPVLAGIPNCLLTGSDEVQFFSQSPQQNQIAVRSLVSGIGCLGKLLYLSVCTHVAPALGLCPPADPAARLLSGHHEGQESPIAQTLYSSPSIQWEEAVLSFPLLASLPSSQQQAEAP